ncbi:hypothetical protein [uncultured Methanolobus sp.]|uniref:hypothetical protein n=1 Tax=uncultured Methanolobus sp. TaxID=218300 RepID=UPI002AAB782D|nr:hypothetical protein [uncultured Methanolobus sp.]
MSSSIYYLSDLLPLLPVIVGGALTIIGGIVSNTVLASRNIKNENRALRREKLEEIYSLNQSFYVSLRNQSTSFADLNDLKVAESNFNRINMLANLYHPWLKDDFKVLRLAYHEHMKSDLPDNITIGVLEDKIKWFLEEVEKGFTKFV